MARIALGMQDKIFLGNLDAQRDWGHAKDYVEAMYLMLQQETAEDYVVATGITTTVREFVRMAFAEAGIELEFSGSGADEKAVVKAVASPDIIVQPGTVVVAIDAAYYRPTEVDLLIGDPTKAKTQLGWEPKYDLPALVKEMVASDLALFRREKLLKDQGFQVLNQYE